MSFLSDCSLPYDIAFVGAGLSSSTTLVAYLDELTRIPLDRPRRLLMIDKSPDMFKGIAYGVRSGDTSLTINCMGEFLPELEHERFFAWFNEHKHELLERFTRQGGPFASRWLTRHRQELENNDLDKMYLPRYIFGAFLEQRVKSMIATAEAAGHAQVETAVALVEDIRHADDLFMISGRLANDIRRNWQAERLVMGLGSPPKRPLVVPLERNRAGQCVVLTDPFESGLDRTAKVVYAQLSIAPPGERRVVVVGTNASAVDMLTNLSNSRGFVDLVDEVIMVSPSGTLPERYREADIDVPFEASNLMALGESDSLMADQLEQAAAADVIKARDEGVPIAASLASISSTVFSLLNKLDAEQMQRFVAHTGNAIGKLQRRAGEEYCDVLEALMGKGKLLLRAARFDGYELGECGRLQIQLGDRERKQSSTLKDVCVLIDCTGSGRLDDRVAAPFVNKLVQRGLCRVNDSRIGLEVDAQRQTCQPGMYVIGPMLAGNLVANKPIWHVEHCGRIIEHARELAAHLSQEIEPDMVMPAARAVTA